MKTISNCRIIKNFNTLGQPSPKQTDGKCEGYNTSYYQVDGKFSSCDKCKLNIKHK